MKNHRLHWLRSIRAAFTLLAAGLALACAPAHATPGQDAGDLATQFERLSKGALLAERGDPEGFKQMRESREAFSRKLEALRSSSRYGLCNPLGLSAGAKEKLAAVAEVWARVDKATAALLEREDMMRQDMAALKQINDAEKPVLELTEQVSALALQANAEPRVMSVSGQLVMLHMRIIKNANALLTPEMSDPDVFFLFGKDNNTFRDLENGLRLGSDTLRLLPSNGDMLVRLTELNTRFQANQQSAAVIQKSAQQLIIFKSTAQQIAHGEGFYRMLLDLENQIGASAIC